MLVGHSSGGALPTNNLRAAGVPVTTVRYASITHDFMPDAVSETNATRAAIAQAIAVLRGALGTA